jgi:hypothetical protein
MAALARTPVLPEGDPCRRAFRPTEASKARAYCVRFTSTPDCLPLIEPRPLPPTKRACNFSPHLLCWLVLAQPHVNRLPQEPIACPSQIGDLGDQLRLDPMDAGRNERRSETSLPRRKNIEKRLGARSRPNVNATMALHAPPRWHTSRWPRRWSPGSRFPPLRARR